MTMFRHNPKFTIETGIMLPVVFLAGFGVLMIYDASAVSAALRNKFSSQYYFLIRQAIWFVVGLGLMNAVSRMPVSFFRKYSIHLLAICIILMILVLIPGIGTEAGHARRWIRLGPASIQPGEFIKLILVLFLANLLSRKEDSLDQLALSTLPAVVVTGVASILLILQPKMSSAILLALISGILMFVVGIPIRHLFLISLTGLPVILWKLRDLGYILRRIDAWIHPMDHYKGTAFQTLQSLIAIGSGGLSGTGLGQGQQKMFYLPEAHTDFIFSVIAEELGLIGSLTVLACFAWLTYSGFYTAANCTNLYAQLLATGLTCIIILPACLNLMVVTGMFPVTGIPLPFISFGGSALVTDMTAAGMLLGIARRELA